MENQNQNQIEPNLGMNEIDYYLDVFCSSFIELSTNSEIAKNIDFKKKLFF